MVRSAPTVTVLMPVKNPHREYFAAAVESILSQTFADLELLVVETPANQSAAAILSQFEDDRIRHVVLENPTSLVDQLNHGLSIARGEFVARMDADDVARLDRLERQAQCLEEHSEIDVVGSQLEVIDESGRTVRGRSYPLDHDSIVEAMRRLNPMAHPAVMFRTETVVQAGGYRYPERAAQDYELWSRLAKEGKRFANLAEPLLQYRVHRGAIKVQRVRDTLRSTLQTKQMYWRDSMSWADLGRMWIERAALYAPPGIVLWAFHNAQYHASKAARSRR